MRPVPLTFIRTRPGAELVNRKKPLPGKGSAFSKLPVLRLNTINMIYFVQLLTPVFIFAATDEKIFAKAG